MGAGCHAIELDQAQIASIRICINDDEGGTDPTMPSLTDSSSERSDFAAGDRWQYEKENDNQD